jgi:hypothetical protein
MTRSNAFWLAVLFATVFVGPAQAADPILRSSIDPPRVVTGQSTTLRVVVLAPNYMTTPPVVPDFQLRNAVTRPLAALNLVEQHDGATYAGVQYEFQIFPQEPGNYAIKGQTIAVTYAADPPTVRQASLPMPAVSFESFIPDASQDLDPFIAAAALTIDQSVKTSSNPLKVGDAITRIITAKADGTPAMLLAPMTFPAIDGLALYPAQPVLKDSSGGRTDDLSSTRMDEATYMIEKPGDYVLPGVEVRWWSSRNQTIERARLDSIRFTALDNPGLRAGDSSPWARRLDWRVWFEALVDNWPYIIAALAAIGAIIWASPRAWRMVATWQARRRAAYRASEAWSYARLRKAGHHGDARKTYFALLDWLARCDGLAPDRTISALKTASRDQILCSQIDGLEQQLFDRASDPVNWSPRVLLRRIELARRRLRQRSGRYLRRPLPPSLNPVAIPGGMGVDGKRLESSTGRQRTVSRPWRH